MGFKVIQKGKIFKVMNTTTKKVGKDRFKTRKNAQIQVANRYRFLKMIKNKT